MQSRLALSRGAGQPGRTRPGPHECNGVAHTRESRTPGTVTAMEQGNPQPGHDDQAEPDRRSSFARNLNDQAEPRDMHRHILNRVSDGPVTVAELVAELYGLPASAAWARPWRSRVISAVNCLAERGRVGWVSVDGEPAATRTTPAELPDPGPAAAANARQSASEPFSGPQSRPVAPGPSPDAVRGPREARQRRVRLAADRNRGVEDIPLPS
jgi:hypothetical protein